eukprot:CAMPEP_0197625930 /NCGR_PEP_ID=MMETSP1338-20131121/5139_1 /TAXON_ID=43686 ORGANISM="Pelagodinium beii, Strain RCC1491" /NCGR_SAMPLE_ID=MMETSP1338 /ASSEMBLY_ACC=CAM_ASM_000754 /LENGTH=182 /DNA_ID=CAMNT_0043196439 /DNA_START=220 /DNA_END=768 /DNA_ORIENTATION=+
MQDIPKEMENSKEFQETCKKYDKMKCSDKSDQDQSQECKDLGHECQCYLADTIVAQGPLFETKLTTCCNPLLEAKDEEVSGLWPVCKKFVHSAMDNVTKFDEECHAHALSEALMSPREIFRPADLLGSTMTVGFVGQAPWAGLGFAFAAVAVAAISAGALAIRHLENLGYSQQDSLVQPLTA